MLVCAGIFLISEITEITYNVPISILSVFLVLAEL